MVKWKYSIRKIGGKRKKVKYYKKSNGNYKVRVVGFRNTIDSRRIK